MIRAWVVVLAVFLPARMASAQTVLESEPAAPASPVNRAPLETSSLFAAGVDFGAPYKLAGSLRHDLAFSRGGSGSDNLFLVQSIASVGLGGAKAGLGIGVAGSAGLFTARATLAQTFSHLLGIPGDRGWVGGEVEWTFFHLVSAQAGVLRLLGGGEAVFTWSVGIGVPLVSLDGLNPANP